MEFSFHYKTLNDRTQYGIFCYTNWNITLLAFIYILHMFLTSNTYDILFILQVRMEHIENSNENLWTHRNKPTYWEISQHTVGDFGSNEPNDIQINIVCVNLQGSIHETERKHANILFTLHLLCCIGQK